MLQVICREASSFGGQVIRKPGHSFTNFTVCTSL